MGTCRSAITMRFTLNLNVKAALDQESGFKGSAS